MTNDELARKWPTVKNKILDRHPKLTSEELVYEIGKEEELLLTLQEKLKMNKIEIDKMLSLFGG